MKQALIVIDGDAAGGAERIATLVANGLAKRAGWRVTFAVMSCELEQAFSRTALDPSITISFGAFRKARFSLPLFPLRLFFKRYDFAFSTHVHLNFLLCVMRSLRLINIRRLVTRETTVIFDRFHGVRRMAFALMYRGYGAQDLIVVQTHYMGEHIKPFIPRAAREKIQVLANPVDLMAIEKLACEPLAAADQELLAGKSNILVCGRLVDVKQPILALDVFDRARSKQNRPLQLVFLGDGPLHLAVEAEAKARQIANHIAFLGWRANPYQIMHACEYGLLTSAREGFPNVVLEMMACGMKTVVMTPCCGDLDTLAGVRVSSSFSADELAGLLTSAIVEHIDLGNAYRRTVGLRSIDRYVQSILNGA